MDQEASALHLAKLLHATAQPPSATMHHLSSLSALYRNKGR